MRTFLFLLVCILVEPLAAQHSALYPVSIKEQAEVSTVIVEGEVVAQKCVWNKSHDFIYTLSIVEVYKSFKGQADQFVTVCTAGGIVDNEGVEVSESLKLKHKDKGVFMLKESDANVNSELQHFDVVSDLQGFYTYEIHKNECYNPFYRFQGIDEFYKLMQVELDSPFEIIKENDWFTGNPGAMNKTASVSFSPKSTSAGTRSVVTLTGSGFGTASGDVAFKWADDGGQTYKSVLGSQIISWTDTEIKVEVPSFAGTGTIQVTDANSVSQESSSALTITFAQTNYESSGQALFTSLIDQDSDGGYTWHMFTDFDANQNAKTDFLNAFYTWKCSSEVNWKMGAVTTTDSTKVDGENVIRFDNGNELPMGVLGRCVSHFFVCGSPQVASVIEIDMIIDDGVTFHYGPGSPPQGVFDFQSVVVHELGHGHQLGHVIDSNDIMYYGLAPGVSRRNLGSNDVVGGDFVQDRCEADSACQFGRTTALLCSIGLHEEQVEFSAVYPNPAIDHFFVVGEKNDKLSLFNSLGQMVVFNSGYDGTKWKVDCSKFPEGVYLLIKESSETKTMHRIIIQ